MFAIGLVPEINLMMMIMQRILIKISNALYSLIVPLFPHDCNCLLSHVIFLSCTNIWVYCRDCYV